MYVQNLANYFKVKLISDRQVFDPHLLPDPNLSFYLIRVNQESNISNLWLELQLVHIVYLTRTVIKS